jgi:hypothetical protein
LELARTWIAAQINDKQRLCEETLADLIAARDALAIPETTTGKQSGGQEQG